MNSSRKIKISALLFSFLLLFINLSQSVLAYNWLSVDILNSDVGNWSDDGTIGGLSYDLNDGIITTYYDGDDGILYYAYAPDPLSPSWTTTAIFSETAGGYGLPSDIIVHPNDGADSGSHDGDILIIFQTASDTLNFAVCTAANGNGANCSNIANWSTGQIKTGISLFGDLDYDSLNGKYGITYAQSTEIHYDTSLSGTTWNPINSWTSTESKNDKSHSSLAYDASGQAAIIHYNGYTGPLYKPSLEWYDGATWSTKNDFESGATYNGIGPDIDFDSNGYPRITYINSSTGNYTRLILQEYNGSIWNSYTIMNSTYDLPNNAEGAKTSLQIRSDDVNTIVYTTPNNNGTSKIRYVEKDCGGGWCSPEDIADGQIGGEQYGSPKHIVSDSTWDISTVFYDDGSTSSDFIYSSTSHPTGPSAPQNVPEFNNIVMLTSILLLLGLSYNKFKYLSPKLSE